MRSSGVWKLFESMLWASKEHVEIALDNQRLAKETKNYGKIGHHKEGVHSVSNSNEHQVLKVAKCRRFNSKFRNKNFIIDLDE